MLHAVGHSLCLLHSRTYRQINLYGKLVPVCRRHQFLRHLTQQESSGHNRKDTHGKSHVRMGKTAIQHLVISFLKPIHNGKALFLTSHRLADEPELHEGHQQSGNQQRNGQNERDGPRETDQKIMEHALHDHQEGEEGYTDGQRSRKD